MIVTYRNGNTVEAFLVSRTDTRLRAMVKGTRDTLEFNDVNGTWVSDDCEPVRIQFAWQGRESQDAVSEADCICSIELAETLIRLLRECEDEPDAPRPDTRRRGVVPADASPYQSSLAACGAN